MAHVHCSCQGVAAYAQSQVLRVEARVQNLGPAAAAYDQDRDLGGAARFQMLDVDGDGDASAHFQMLNEVGDGDGDGDASAHFQMPNEVGDGDASNRFQILDVAVDGDEDAAVVEVAPLTGSHEPTVLFREDHQMVYHQRIHEVPPVPMAVKILLTTRVMMQKSYSGHGAQSSR